MWNSLVSKFDLMLDWAIFSFADAFWRYPWVAAAALAVTLVAAVLTWISAGKDKSEQPKAEFRPIRLR